MNTESTSSAKRGSKSAPLSGVLEVPAGSAEAKPEQPPAKKPPFSDRETAKNASGSTIAIKFNGDGTPDLASMRPATKDRFKKFLEHPATVSEFGITTAKIEPMVVDAQAVGALLDTIGSVKMLVYGAKFDLPREVIQQAAFYSPEQKQIITPLAQKVIAKHSSEFLNKWSDEISLGLVLVGIELAKFKQLQALVAQKNSPAPVKAESANGESKSEMPVQRGFGAVPTMNQ